MKLRLRTFGRENYRWIHAHRCHYSLDLQRSCSLACDRILYSVSLRDSYHIVEEKLSFLALVLDNFRGRKMISDDDKSESIAELVDYKIQTGVW